MAEQSYRLVIVASGGTPRRGDAAYGVITNSTTTPNGEIMRLMDTTTETEIMPGTMLRPIEGPRRVWRYEGLAEVHGAPMVHASQGVRTGRVHRHFHPHVFGLDIVIDVQISYLRHARNAAHVVWSRMSDWLMAGLVALIPLAFFEYFHLADRLFEYVGAGRH